MSNASHYTATFATTLPGSTKMMSMHEALARERMEESRRTASMARIANQMASARRWRRLERIARSVHQRHARSAAQAAVAVRWD
jgi:hypothetical protein